MKLFKRSLPTLILEVLSDGPEFGYEIAKRIKRMEPGVLDNQEALLYPDLYELEMKGILESYTQPYKEGRVRRYYRITQKGRRLMKRDVKELKRILAMPALAPEGAA